MQFIIMDLEWNNTYAKKKKGFLNEIIEIGAVKLDSHLNQVDTFSQVIKSQVGKRLRSSVKKLTNITNDDVRGGELFTKTFSEFKKWLGTEENTFFTWGDGDIRVLIENYQYLNGIETIPFMDNYCDLQACYHHATGTGKGMQVGLHAAAEHFGIDPEAYSLHRALGDSLLTAEVFRKIYDAKMFSLHTSACNGDFYSKLFFKPKVISNIDNPLVDKSEFFYNCEKCGHACNLKGQWRYHNQFFRAVYFCPDCKAYYKVGVRFKKYYDRVDIRKIATQFDPEQKKKEGAEGVPSLRDKSSENASFSE